MHRREQILISPERPALLVVAAPKEALAVLGGIGGDRAASLRFHRWEAIRIIPGIELLMTGVGKACAAGALATVFDPTKHGAVINTGVAGLLPLSDGSDGSAGMLDVVLADASVYADEGIETPDGFADVASMGFSPAPPGFEAMGLTAPGDPWLLELLRPLTDHVGPIATVSTCAGTDAIAQEVAARTGAIAEAMEGASVGFTTLCVSASRDVPAVPFVEARVISNTTGDRTDQRWDLTGALKRLRVFSERLPGALL